MLLRWERGHPRAGPIEDLEFQFKGGSLEDSKGGNDKIPSEFFERYF